MPSPFPGMNPYLEEPDIWSDFHTTFYMTIRAELNVLLPPGYVARIDRYVWLQEPDTSRRVRLGKPDVFVTGDGGMASRGGSATLLAAPAHVVLPAIRREGPRYLKIIDRRNRRVVTAVKILSPANKSKGEDRELYLVKRNEYLATGVNLVEIDLLRSWERMPLDNPPPALSDYLILVSRASEFPQAGVWPLSVRDPLPTIPIPLTSPDPDVPLPLKPCFDRACAEGRYESDINYAEPPAPPLTEPDATWARDLLAGWSNGQR